MNLARFTGAYEFTMVETSITEPDPHPILQVGLVATPALQQDYPGFVTEPIKSTIPRKLSRIAKKKGRSTFMTNFSRGC